MKNIIFLIIFLIHTLGLAAQGDPVTLTGCIDAALKNKDDIKAVRTDLLASGLQTKSIKAGYLPEVSIGYDFRYNIIIPAQIVPVGLFYPVPTDATQAIKFGTQWQQNAGLSLYQPLIDLTVKNHIAESHINEKIQSNTLAGATQDLQAEVINSYLLIWLKQQELNSAATDTLSTFRMYTLLKARYNEGRVFEADLNKALINHNKTLTIFRQSYSDLLKEKIYMSFLTGFPLSSLLNREFDFTPLKSASIFDVPGTPLYDSLPAVQQLLLNLELTGRQEKSERSARVPKIGLEGFVGSNQYTNSFDPLGAANWYGSSYFGLSVKVPVFSGSGINSRVKQLRIQQQSLNYRIKDAKESINNQNLKLMQDINTLKSQISLADINIRLLEDNLKVYQERFNSGQINSYDMIAGEIDLQKEKAEREELRTELLQKQFELIRNSGMITLFIDRVSQITAKPDENKEQASGTR
jgi:outer membrane protein